LPSILFATAVQVVIGCLPQQIEQIGIANRTVSTPTPTKQQRNTCKTEQGLVRCQGCQVVFYCGRDH
jgi:hypothetical protein